MRIIAGKAKGRKLKGIKGTITRPTLDRVKEAIFNILEPYIVESNFLDLFAGFGGLGLEALSRGAAQVTFVEKNHRNIKIIKENLKLSGLDEQALVIKRDVFDYLKQTKDKYDIIILDPPYGQGLGLRTLKLIKDKNIFKKEGLIIVEHSKKNSLLEFNKLPLIKEKKYGDSYISIYLGKEV